MPDPLRRPRSLRAVLAAIVALGLTAGAAFAGGGAAPPDAASSGLGRAQEASGKIVPVRAGADVEASTPAEEEAPESDGEEEGSDDTHGAGVSEAARSGPPEADAHLYRNHGAWVSSVARDNHGRERAGERATAGAGRSSAPARGGAAGR